MRHVTFALITYNQQEFVADAIEAAMRQTYPHIDFIISDDCSTDGTVQGIQKACEQFGKRRNIQYLTAERNVGIGGNINRIMTVARGDIIVIAAGDDVSSPDRVRCVVEAFEEVGPSCFSVFSSYKVFEQLSPAQKEEFLLSRQNHFRTEILSAGLPEYIERLRPLVTGATHAWRREVFDRFGPLRAGVMFEDMAITFRSLALGRLCKIHEPLVLYRRHGANLSFNRADSRHTSLTALQAVKRKEQKYLGGYLTGYKAMKSDLRRVPNITAVDTARCSQLLNKKILYYRVALSNRDISFVRRCKRIGRYLTRTGNFRATGELLKLLIPENWLDRIRVAKQRFANG